MPLNCDGEKTDDDPLPLHDRPRQNDVPGTNEPHGLNPERRPTGDLAGYDEAIEYLFGRIDYERFAPGDNQPDFRLDRTAELFRRLGLSRFLHKAYQQADANLASSAASQPSVPAVESLAPGSPAPESIPIVHVAGTKGKGSTSTMVSAILSAAGLRVGLYTSPHLTRLNERFRVDGIPCRDDELTDLVASVRPTVETLDEEGQHASFFELTTAMAALHFQRRHCDAVVLEVGLGGRLDSTNVCASTVTAITSIGLDHQNVLGDTVEAIAREKAGIIKPNTPVVCGVRDPGPLNVISDVAKTNAAPIVCVKTDYDVGRPIETATGLRFRYRTVEPAVPGHAKFGDSVNLDIELPLVGHHQAENAATAISICRLLRQRLSQSVDADMPCGTSAEIDADASHAPSALRSFAERLTDEAICTGLRNVCCVGRLERFQLPDGRPTLVLDTAHNPDSILALCQAIRSRIGLKPDSAAFAHPIVLVFGTSRDKDIRAMTKQLSALADQIICTQYQTNPRAMLVEDVEAAFRETAGTAKLQLESIRDPIAALWQAIGMQHSGLQQAGIQQAQLSAGDQAPSASGDPVPGTVVVCGSFYLAGELRQEIMRLCDPDAHVDHRAERLLSRS
ncbi:bifunctional folylpolyglutamate synthase/dihydrofolate synthase [Roseiconus lacunae]|uniref:bifunctional folylpolyglutamate synthase/dihydrofolate synthase n=1 Tax=Roseiconus lacunae TaxID=2605694 RepID=UPI0011F3EAE0|nr:folylpolyglutamate synthase/dihydrofolate synthase family protein [Roseiconus lacunae]